jgi:5-methylcytosine-specific restriction protein B
MTDPPDDLRQLALHLERVDLSSTKSDKFKTLQAWLAPRLGLTPGQLGVKWIPDSGRLGPALGELATRLQAESPRVGVLLLGEKMTDAIFERAAVSMLEASPAADAFAAFAATKGGWRFAMVVQPQGSPWSDKLRAVFGTHRVVTTGASATTVPEAVPPPKMGSPPGDTEALARRLFVSKAWIDDVLWYLHDRNKAVVFYGPPGTGKTYVARKIAEHVQADSELRPLVQLHPSFGYENFFEGYQPHAGSEGSPMALRLVPGPLQLLSERVRSRNATGVMVLDEINRGNLPRVFGELYFLLEYRGESVLPMYSPEKPFTLPEQLHFIGTMNTADRSAGLLDQALRRRFHFIPMFPDAEPVRDMLRLFIAALKNGSDLRWLPGAVALANERLVHHLGPSGRHYQIGPSHFMREDLDGETLRRVWKAAVLPSVEEHFFDRPEVLDDLQLERLRVASSA